VKLFARVLCQIAQTVVYNIYNLYYYSSMENNDDE
jgi:hypothetical protein